MPPRCAGSLLPFEQAPTSKAIPLIEAGEAPCVARMVRDPGPCVTWAEPRSIFAGCVAAALACYPTRKHAALGGKTSGGDNYPWRPE